MNHLVEPAYISFEDGVVCPAFNQEDWANPTKQLRERVLSYGGSAKLLDAEYNVLAEMTYMQALKEQV